jgi:hypothetical protein
MKTLATRFVLLGAGCALAATMVLVALPVILGSPRPMIHVSWRGVSPGERNALERQFGLAAPLALGDSSWAYEPTDTSTETLRAIVNHPSVVGTEGIDRRALRMASSPPLSPRRGGLLQNPPAWAGRVAKLLAYSLIVVALFLLFRAALMWPRFPARKSLDAAVSRIQADPAGTARALPGIARTWVSGGVPAASAEGAGLFRVIFGGAVFAFLTMEPANLGLLESYEPNAAEGVYGMAVRWLAAHPVVPQALGWWLTTSGALFVVGLWTPMSFACFVAGFAVWSSIFTLTTSTHAVAAIGLTLVCLLPARWGDAWSVDAWLRRVFSRPQRPATAAQYGYAFWIPRLVFGLAFLAAAWSKVSGGPAWILNGTVKYHYVTDLDHALVSWGPQLTQYHWVAVAMSATAVIVEALVITASFSRSTLYILLCGAGSMALLSGFALFQGVIWPGWWTLLLGFLPWERVGAVTAEEPGHASLTVTQWTVASLLVVQQCLASLFHVEARPLTSAYDMYSATYGSAEEYASATNLVYHVLAYEADTVRDLSNCVVDDRTAGLLPAAARGSASERERLKGVLAPCLRGQNAVTAFSLQGDRREYDWQARRFTFQRGLDVIGPYPADWLFR